MKCLNCDIDFIPTREWQIFCSIRCRTKSHQRKLSSLLKDSRRPKRDLEKPTCIETAPDRMRGRT